MGKVERELWAQLATAIAMVGMMIVMSRISFVAVGWGVLIIYLLRAALDPVGAKYAGTAVDGGRPSAVRGCSRGVRHCLDRGRRGTVVTCASWQHGDTAELSTRWSQRSPTACCLLHLFRSGQKRPEGFLIELRRVSRRFTTALTFMSRISSFRSAAGREQRMTVHFVYSAFAGSFGEKLRHRTMRLAHRCGIDAGWMKLEKM